MAGYPPTPAYIVLNTFPTLVMAAWALAAAALLTFGAPNARMAGAVMAGLLWLFVVVCFSAAVGLSTATLTYLGMAWLAFDVLAGGAE